jgi:choline dehydrogenase
LNFTKLEVYLRGNPKDFDYWVQMGAEGWSWKEVYQFFLKSENNTDPIIAKNGFHSTNGPLTVSTPPVVHPLTQQWVKASESLGYHIIDLNGNQRLGTNVTQRNVREGVRQSSSQAYLSHSYKRRNLHILTNSFATKIIFNRRKRAIGVEFKRNGRTYRVGADVEVIVSAGTINSPQLLMLSGIGFHRKFLNKVLENYLSII